jgi:hypothetical protein
MGLLIRCLQGLEAVTEVKLGGKALGNRMFRIGKVETKLHGGARMTHPGAKQGGKGLHRRPCQAEAPASLPHEGPESFLIGGR